MAVTILAASLLGVVGFASGWLAVGDSTRHVGRLRSADLNELPAVSVSTSARAIFISTTTTTRPRTDHAPDGDGDD